MVPSKPIPRHVALIPDGNRRWSAKSGWPLRDSYKRGADAINSFVNYWADLGVEFITVWPISDLTSSRENAELKVIFDVVEEYVDFAVKTYPSRGYRSRSIGNLQQLQVISQSLLDSLQRLTATTEKSRGTEIIFAICYTGRDEIARAVQRILTQGILTSEITPDVISSNLDTAGIPDVDLLIRTGGDRRLSGFLPFQSTYAEIHFSNTLLPDLEPDELGRILELFGSRRYSQ